MVVADSAFTFPKVHPLTFSLETRYARVPALCEVYKMKAMQLFYLRSVVMILSFVLILLAYFQYESPQQTSCKAKYIALSRNYLKARIYFNRPLSSSVSIW